MKIDAAFLIPLFIICVIVAILLFGISRIKSQSMHERGHFVLSFIPWLHLLATFIIALYIRFGFGSWPQCCTDNPDLPMIDGLVMGLVFGLYIIPVGTPLWLGWFIIRLRKNMKRYWLPSTALFFTGIILMIVIQTVDPLGFWGWVWD